MNSQNEAEILLEYHLQECFPQAKIEREFQFCPGRKFRSDLAIPTLKLLFEVNGGVYSRGRHVRPAGFQRDANKRNAALVLGYKPYEFTTEDVMQGRDLVFLKAEANKIVGVNT